MRDERDLANDATFEARTIQLCSEIETILQEGTNVTLLSESGNGARTNQLFYIDNTYLDGTSTMVQLTKAEDSPRYINISTYEGGIVDRDNAHGLGTRKFSVSITNLPSNHSVVLNGQLLDRGKERHFKEIAEHIQNSVTTKTLDLGIEISPAAQALREIHDPIISAFRTYTGAPEDLIHTAVIKDIYGSKGVQTVRLPMGNFFSIELHGDKVTAVKIKTPIGQLFINALTGRTLYISPEEEPQELITDQEIAFITRTAHTLLQRSIEMLTYYQEFSGQVYLLANQLISELDLSTKQRNGTPLQEYSGLFDDRVNGEQISVAVRLDQRIHEAINPEAIITVIHGANGIIAKDTITVSTRTGKLGASFGKQRIETNLSENPRQFFMFSKIIYGYILRAIRRLNLAPCG